MNQDQQQQYVPVQQEMRFNPYKPRYISYVTIFLGAAGALFMIAHAIAWLFAEEIHIEPLQPYLAMVPRPALLFSGIGLLVTAMLAEVNSRMKTPPATWRVKNELIRTLAQNGLLDIYDVSTWKGMFAVAPVGRYNREAQSFTIPFLLRHANARQFFDKIGDSISGFARCQSAVVEEDNSKRLYNCKLILWYTDNPYGEVSLETDLFEDD